MTHASGGFTFAESPEVDAPEARIIWHASLDPGTLPVVATPSTAGHPDAIVPEALAPWLAVSTDGGGEHAVLSDGWHHIRIDVTEGSIADGPVILGYRFRGLVSAKTKILPLRRLIDLSQRRQFLANLYPPDRRVGRWIAALQIFDAVAAGASQREIVRALYGEMTGEDAGRRDDSLRSRIRRLAREAASLARGGYRHLMIRSTER